MYIYTCANMHFIGVNPMYISIHVHIYIYIYICILSIYLSICLYLHIGLIASLTTRTLKALAATEDALMTSIRRFYIYIDRYIDR